MNTTYRVLLVTYNLLIFALASHTANQVATLAALIGAAAQILGTIEVLAGIFAHNGKIEIFGLTLQIFSFLALGWALKDVIDGFAIIGAALIANMLISRWVRLYAILTDPAMDYVKYVGDK